jgi:hypothetical protein
MDGPSVELRQNIGERLRSGEGLGDAEREALASDVLGRVEGELANDVARGFDQEPDQVLSAVDAWAGLASYVVARTYAPASPWQLRIGGWGRDVPEKLREATNTLRGPLSAAARKLGAVSWTISVGLPWGVSVGITWT